MRDPYDVLGVTRDATDDEIKKAYRTLSRRYHPDANIDNPNKEQAEERFKEVQQAYEAIQNGKTGYGGYGPGSSYGSGGYSSGGYSSGGFNSGFYGGFGPFGFGSFSGQNRQQGGSETDIHLQAAANYINSRHFAEALNVLGNIKERDARWYYYSAVANAGSGNNVLARQLAQTAVEMDPDNITYRQYLSQLEGGGSWYRGMGDQYGAPMETDSDICTKLCLANLICGMCGPGACCCM